MKAFSKPFHLLLKGLWHLSSANFLTRIHFHTNNRGIEPNYFIQVLKFPANKSKKMKQVDVVGRRYYGVTSCTETPRLRTNPSNVRVQYIFGLGDAVSPMARVETKMFMSTI